LWDLRGQVWQAPVSDLLGGRFRDRLPAYLSGLRKPSPEERIRAAKECAAAGMAGVKLFTGKASPEFLSELRAVREAIGPETLLAVDCINACDRAGALRIGSVLDELNGSFLEAPVGAEDMEGHREVGSRLKTRIAAGEYLRSVQQLVPWLKSGAIQIAQPDVVRSGITAARRMAAVAQAFHVPVSLHVGVSTGIGMAATWQVAASLPNFLVQEHQFDLFETANRVLETPLTAQNGELIVPDGPGLGVRVLEQTVLEQAAEHWVVTPDGAVLDGAVVDNAALQNRSEA
ncbi:MAG: mandelate racemase/muconate lactonizing enzyme family protein, partial [Bryobacteraceae bacterium]